MSSSTRSADPEKFRVENEGPGKITVPLPSPDGANSRQIGGNHYKADYQHWDWVADIGLDYYRACATKYLTRWRRKNGLEDLRKAGHFYDKFCELLDTGRYVGKVLPYTGVTDRFIRDNGLEGTMEAEIIRHIITNSSEAQRMLGAFIKSMEMA